MVAIAKNAFHDPYYPSTEPLPRQTPACIILLPYYSKVARARPCVVAASSFADYSPVCVGHHMSAPSHLCDRRMVAVAAAHIAGSLRQDMFGNSAETTFAADAVHFAKRVNNRSWAPVASACVFYDRVPDSSISPGRLGIQRQFPASCLRRRL